MAIEQLLEVMWRDYAALAPEAERLRRLLAERSEILCDDHIAVRTFGAPGLGIEAVARPFEALGWRARERYRSRDQRARARCWQHADPALPKLFISELVLEELSLGARALVEDLLAQLPFGFAERGAWGRPWQLSQAVYRALATESEYAAWVAAFGVRVHHVAVDVASLATFPDLEALDAFLVEHGFALAAHRGPRADRLERLATRPDRVVVAFSDSTARIPAGHYEFARRYALAGGERFHGFVSPATDRITAPAAVQIG